MHITKSKLKQIVLEELHNMLQEEETAWQEEDVTVRQGDNYGGTSTKTSKHRGIGPDPFGSKKAGEYMAPMEVGQEYSRTRETGKEAPTVTSKETFQTPGAAEKLEFTPWKGTVKTKAPEGLKGLAKKAAKSKWHPGAKKKHVRTGEAAIGRAKKKAAEGPRVRKKTEFIQAPETRWGQLGTTRQVAESQLKQIVLEELTKLLLEQETNDKTWVGMNSAQVKKEMAKAGVKYEKGWAGKLPVNHPVRAKYREYWKARGANQGASRARPAAGGSGGQTSGRSAGAAKARDLELRRQAGMLDPEGSQLADVRRGGIPGFHGSGLGIGDPKTPLGIGDHEKQEGEKAKPVPKIWALTSRVHQAIEDENKDTHGVIYTWEVKDMMEKNPGMSRQDAITSVVRGKDPAIDALIRSGEIKGLGEKPDAPEESVADSYKKAQEQEQEQEQVGPPAPEAKKVATGSTETTI